MIRPISSELHRREEKIAAGRARHPSSYGEVIPQIVTNQQQRKEVMTKAEMILNLYPNSVFTEIIRELMLELALLDGAHELLRHQNRNSTDAG